MPTATAPAPTSAPPAPAKPISPPSPSPTVPQKSPNSTPEKTPPSPEDQSVFGDTFAELDAMDKGAKPVDVVRKTVKKPESTPAAHAPDAKEKEQPSTTESPEDAGSAKPVSPEVKPVKAADLRAAYDQSKQKVKEYEGKLAAAEAKIKEYESKPPADNKPLMEKLAALEKENNEFKEELKFTNYVKHPEFHEKYQKPYTQAWEKAVSEIGQLTVANEDGSTRQATANDVLALANSPLATLDERAESMFGRSAARVVRHIERIRELAEAQEKAIADARNSSTEREKQQQIANEQRMAKIGNIIETTNKTLKEKYPRWFGHEETDPEGNQLFDKGMEYADQAFNGQSALPEDERVRRITIIRNKAANHDRLASHLKNAKARIAELEATVAEYEKSEPTTGKASDATPAKPNFGRDAYEAEIDALDRK